MGLVVICAREDKTGQDKSSDKECKIYVIKLLYVETENKNSIGELGILSDTLWEEMIGFEAQNGDR